jgi:DNA-binding MarR family transcriptional regulator
MGVGLAVECGTVKKTSVKTLDHVGEILRQWAQERPDLDTSPMGVVGRVWRVSQILRRRMEEVFAGYDLRGGGFDVMAALRRAGPPYKLTPTALYNSLMVSSGAMTNRLDRLSAAGLIERIPDTRDRRSILVGLTPKGRKLIDRAVVTSTEVEREMLAALTPSEQKLVAGLLRKWLLAHEDHSSQID